MSKKTRKKTSKASSGKSSRTSAAKPAAAKASRGSKTSARGSAAKASKTASKASAGKAAAKGAVKVAGKKPAQEPARMPKAASAKASHKAPSKSLKSNVSAPPREAQPKPAPEQALEADRPPVSEAKLAEVAREGGMAPAFQLPRDGGGSVSLADYAGKKLVLFFYPRADTPGCTREAIDFTRLSDAFAEEGAAVLGVSADSVKAQESFRDKHQLAVPLISDETHEMLEAYGAWGEKSMYGRSFMGIIRTTVLIGADRRIARIWRNVRVDGHADEVLAAVREA
jgi:peroxiredoxin Q/BCP